VKTHILAAALLLCGTAAHAGQVRYPESGEPAITAEIPGGWHAEMRDDGNLHISSIDRNLEVLFSIVPFDGTLDDAASEAMKANHATAPGRGPAVSISGRDGYTYYSMMAGDNGQILNMKMEVVRLDAENVGLFAIISDQKINALMLSAAQGVMDSVKLAPPQ
jgi:hypothetical protein